MSSYVVLKGVIHGSDDERPKARAMTTPPHTHHRQTKKKREAASGGAVSPPVPSEEAAPLPAPPSPARRTHRAPSTQRTGEEEHTQHAAHSEEHTERRKEKKDQAWSGLVRLGWVGLGLALLGRAGCHRATVRISSLHPPRLLPHTEKALAWLASFGGRRAPVEVCEEKRGKTRSMALRAAVRSQP
jgi:hypothetical protein